MKEEEIILVDGIPRESFRAIVEESLRYAIISLPFTVDRMELHSLKSRIFNIAKGKIAEAMFLTFARANNLPVHTSDCRTPFYRPDRRDFILHHLEWDIKNNFLFHSGKRLNGYRYTDLPALVPDKHPGDQWAKRFERKLDSSNGVAFLFTFLRWAPRRRQGIGIFDFDLNPAQQELLARAWAKYKGQPWSEEPFREETFWHEWDRLNSGTAFCRLQVSDFPVLVIGAYAGANEFGRFRPIPGNQTFLNGVLHTRIRNRMALLKDLPSFASLFPHLKHNLRLGRFQDIH